MPRTDQPGIDGPPAMLHCLDPVVSAAQERGSHMTPERWQMVRGILQSAMELRPADYDRF